MKRYRQSQPRSFFRGNESMRLATMVVMLGVLLLLIAKSGDPRAWIWLVGDTGTPQAKNSPAKVENNISAKQSPQTPEKGESHPSEKSAPTDKTKVGPKGTVPFSLTRKLGQSPISAPAGPTDLDPEEADALSEDFPAITDGSISIQDIEMRAYNRLLEWVENQSISQMLSRAKKDPLYTQFYQSPDKYRGQLFAMELSVRRILEYPHDGLMLYEVWGLTEESRSWPYVGVVIDLPKGMPIGPDVYESATLVGYFFKMQGYMEAGAKPHASPLQAPLFIGRLIWRPAQKPRIERSDWTWALFLLAGFLIFLIIRWGLYVRSARRRTFARANLPLKPGGNAVEQWLNEAEANGADEENDPCEN